MGTYTQLGVRGAAVGFLVVDSIKKMWLVGPSGLESGDAV